MRLKYQHPTPEIRKKRTFVPPDLDILSWESISRFFLELEERPIGNVSQLLHWLTDRSELAAILEENLAWRYILMNCDTSDPAFSSAFEDFVREIQDIPLKK